MGLYVPIWACGCPYRAVDMCMGLCIPNWGCECSSGVLRVHLGCVPMQGCACSLGLVSAHLSLYIRGCEHPNTVLSASARICACAGCVYMYRVAHT